MNLLVSSFLLPRDHFYGRQYGVAVCFRWDDGKLIQSFVHVLRHCFIVFNCVSEF